MPVVLKNQVVDALRAARNADDEVTKLKENSWENRRSGLLSLVESGNWKFGPAELIATFDHHLVCKAPNGSLVQVEWSKDDNGYKLGRAVVHETTTPVADLGHELMETAKSVVDHILAEDYTAAQPGIATIAEALDVGGDLQRRVNNEVTIRSFNRNAWWHQVVGARDGIEEKLPTPHTEGDDALTRSVNDLLNFLRESASEASAILRALAESEIANDVEAIARDIIEDTGRAIAALTGVDLNKHEETLQIYEAVVSVTPRLLNGLSFLKELSEKQATDDEG